MAYETLSGLKKGLENSLNIGLMETGKKLEYLLVDKIYDEWYRRSAGGTSYAMYSDKTSSYNRTWQLPKAVSTRMAKDGGVDIFIDPDKLKPMQTKDNKFNTYMSNDKSTRFQDKSISEWVIEWIEEGNSWWWMPPTEVHKKTEMEIERKNLAEKELVKALKNMKIDARRVE